jgi:general secretion pathway protein D
LVVPIRTFSASVYNIDFNDVDIRKVIETVSEITGKNFLIDDRVQGRVTVVGPKSLSAAEIYQVFLSILQVKGYAMVPAGKINKIVPAANVASYGFDTKVGPADERRVLDRYVTQVIPVEFTEAEDLKNLLQPLIPKTDSISAYGPTNLLIITTTESLLSRLSQIISVVDVAGAREEIRIIPVEYAPVNELAVKINQILESQSKKPAVVQRAARGQQPTQQTGPSEAKIIADEREELVRKLDVAIPLGVGRVHVYYLQNADAEELAKVLSGIPLEESSSQAEGAAPTPQVQAAIRARAAGKEPEVSIIADNSTNSLVITSTIEKFEILKQVIRQLDIPRDQVLVEVLIAEVGLTKTLDIGVEWRVANEFSGGDFIGFGGTTYGDLDTLVVAFPNTPSGLVAGVIGETISFNVGGETIELPNLGALISLLQTDSDVNILSTPTLVTTDNREAEIVVAKNVPFQTSAKFDSLNQPIITYDYRDVGLTLRITPQISSNRVVKMDIFTQLEVLVSTTVGEGIGQQIAPTTLKRKADTNIVVKDHHTVVIGGLIQEDKVVSKQQVPFLGSLPILGPLFRKEGTVTEKRNLLIFLTPHIIANSEEMRDASKASVSKQEMLPKSAIDGLSFDGEIDQSVVEQPAPEKEEVQ